MIRKASFGAAIANVARWGDTDVFPKPLENHVIAGKSAEFQVLLEEFAKNIARMVEEGGRAMAAYLKPREEGRVDDQQAEIADVVKTFGKVAEYWFADPQRALKLQTSLGKAYLDLWANAVKRMAGEEVAPLAEPEPRDKRFADPEWTTNQFYDFLKQAYLLTVGWANHLVSDAKGLDPHTQLPLEETPHPVVVVAADGDDGLAHPAGFHQG